MTDDELIDAMDGFPCGTEDEGWTFVWTEDDGWMLFESHPDGCVD